MREKIRAELIEEKRVAQLANIHLSDNRAPAQVTAPIPTPPTRAVAPIATASTSTSTPAHVPIPPTPATASAPGPVASSSSVVQTRSQGGGKRGAPDCIDYDDQAARKLKKAKDREAAEAQEPTA